MIRIGRHTAGVSVICAALALACSPAIAGDDAVSKPPRSTKHQRIAPSPSPYGHLERYRSLGFKGEYPGDCAYMRASGRCMIDLGYGRCEPCDMGMNR
jgi:hypothetical protein